MPGLAEEVMSSLTSTRAAVGKRASICSERTGKIHRKNLMLQQGLFRLSRQTLLLCLLTGVCLRYMGWLKQKNLKHDPERDS